MNTQTQNWLGHNIRFIEVDGAWHAVLKDICDALNLRVDKVSLRIDSDDMQRVSVEQKEHQTPVKVESHNSEDTKDGRGHAKTRQMIVVNEHGIYQALFASRKLEARKFTSWVCDILETMRKVAGLQPYEVMRMMEPEVQGRIYDAILDYWYDYENDCWREYRTADGGQVLDYDSEE